MFMEPEDNELLKQARVVFYSEGFHENLINKTLESYKLRKLFNTVPNLLMSMLLNGDFDVNANRDSTLKSLLELFPGQFQIAESGRIEFSDEHPLKNAPILKTNPHDKAKTRFGFDLMGVNKNIGDHCMESNVIWSLINTISDETMKSIRKQQEETNTCPTPLQKRGATFAACERQHPGMFVIAENGRIDWNPAGLNAYAPNMEEANFNTEAEDELKKMCPMMFSVFHDLKMKTLEIKKPEGAGEKVVGKPKEN